MTGTVRAPRTSRPGVGPPRPGSATPRITPGGVGAAFRTDLVLIHAPSVLDFRELVALQGPIADVVPSTGQFEMYPVGLTSIAAYLERNNYNVRIVNMAYRMLRSRRYDPVAHIRRLHAPVFGIDLHWLPHAHGALAVAELVKRLHPDSAVLIGGLSASYYHEELAALPYVDYVLRGDSTEEPCRQLLAALREGTPLEDVDNLTYRRPDGSVAVNPLRFVPGEIDGIDIPGYDYVLRSVLKYRRLRDVVPYLEWLAHPTTMVLNARGCTYDCAICGGSRSAYELTCNRSRLALRSPERLLDDLRTIARFSRSPVFVVHDPRVGGTARANRFFDLLAEAGLPNELVFELFDPAGPDLFSRIQRSVAAWSLEITLESADAALRRANGKFPCSNDQVEATIASALEHGCRKLDLFFMVGIPGQTRASALATVDHCRQLADRFHDDPRLQFYVAPLGPFLDPGSRAFEDPSLGYRRRYATLEEHRRALLEPTWADALSYETETMDRQCIVDTSYDVARGLNELKHERGLIDEATYRTVAEHLETARSALATIDATRDLPAADRRAVLTHLASQIESANTASLCSPEELRWVGPDGLRVTYALAIRLALAFLVEVRRGLARFRGRFDTELWRPRLTPKGDTRAAPGSRRIPPVASPRARRTAERRP